MAPLLIYSKFARQYGLREVVEISSFKFIINAIKWDFIVLKMLHGKGCYIFIKNNDEISIML